LHAGTSIGKVVAFTAHGTFHSNWFVKSLSCCGGGGGVEEVPLKEDQGTLVQMVRGRVSRPDTQKSSTSKIHIPTVLDTREVDDSSRIDSERRVKGCPVEKKQDALSKCGVN